MLLGELGDAGGTWCSRGNLVQLVITLLVFSQPTSPARDQGTERQVGSNSSGKCFLHLNFRRFSCSQVPSRITPSLSTAGTFFGPAGQPRSCRTSHNNRVKTWKCLPGWYLPYSFHWFWRHKEATAFKPGCLNSTSSGNFPRSPSLPNTPSCATPTTTPATRSSHPVTPLMQSR